MRDAILNFPKQFAYEPEIENKEHWKKASKFTVCGMGGSALPAMILKSIKPELDILVHRDYGLPELPDEPDAELIIASSYSGNTEEAISAFEEARKRTLPLAVIAVGGRLLELAKEHGVPYVQIPDTGIQPRSALGFMFKAFLKLMGDVQLLEETKQLTRTLKSEQYEEKGKNLASGLRGHVPIVYASSRYLALAYTWKIKFNETGKVPAFYNVFPELNHNEINSFDPNDASRMLSERFHFVFLKDPSDHPRILKRMEVLEKLYRDKGFPVEIVGLEGGNALEKIFNCSVLAGWASYYTAEQYSLESEEVPMVEEFKKLIL